VYGVHIIKKQEMLLCRKWQLQQMEGKAHTAFEGEWNKLII
jgi:hypothetical protein